jgi:hypothetical protein
VSPAAAPPDSYSQLVAATLRKSAIAVRTILAARVLMTSPGFVSFNSCQAPPSSNW